MFLGYMRFSTLKLGKTQINKDKLATPGREATYMKKLLISTVQDSFTELNSFILHNNSMRKEFFKMKKSS